MSALREIAAIVAEKHGLTVDQLRSPARERRIAWPRQEAMALAYAQKRWSRGQIGRAFNRTSWTVEHGVSAHLKRVAERAQA